MLLIMISLNIQLEYFFYVLWQLINIYTLFNFFSLRSLAAYEILIFCGIVA